MMMSSQSARGNPQHGKLTFCRTRLHRRIGAVALVAFLTITIILGTVSVDFLDPDVVATQKAKEVVVETGTGEVQVVEHQVSAHNCEMERRMIGQTPPDVMPVQPNAWMDCYQEQLPCLAFNDTSRSRNAKYCANGAANRAPFVDRTPLLRGRHPQKSEVGNNVQTTVSNPVTWCFNTAGKALQWPPCWTRPLLDTLERDGLWMDVQHVLRTDPWRILIGWVPSKFMDKQPLGRKANGDVIYPPTRGKNATFYSTEYGSVWEAQFTAGGLPFVFQIVHRNALTVCIHERIHLESFSCTPSASEEPITIHVCGCRKCNIPADRRQLVAEPRAKDSLQVLYPARRHISAVPLLREPSPLLQRTQYVADEALRMASESDCVVADAAPWLFNVSVVRSFPYEGLHHDIDALLRMQATSDGIVTVVIFNQFWIDHLHNYVYGFRAKAGMTNLIVATTDDASLRICVANRLPCLDASLYAEEEEKDKDGRVPKGFSKKVTEEFSWVKPRIVIAVLKRGYHILLSDLDLTWNSNPLRQLIGANVDIAHQCDASNVNSINSGFYFARNKQHVLDFFQTFTAMQPQASADQNSMRLFARYDHSHPVSHSCLPFPSFAMKCYFKVDNSRRVEHDGKETFRWRDHRVQPGESPKWTLLHATCLNGASEKVRYFRTMGVWASDELEEKIAEKQENSTATPKPFCAVVPSGDVIDGRGAHDTNASQNEKRYHIVHHVVSRTNHSARYDDMIENPLYLQPRH